MANYVLSDTDDPVKENSDDGDNHIDRMMIDAMKRLDRID